MAESLLNLGNFFLLYLEMNSGGIPHRQAANEHVAESLSRVSIP